MTDKHFVIIHGLAAKPAPATLSERYLRYLAGSAGASFPADRAQLVYWADLMGYDALDPGEDEYISGGDNFAPYSLWEEIKFHGSGFVRRQAAQVIEGAIENFLQKPDDSSIKQIVSALSGRDLDSVSEHIYGSFLPDLDRYFNKGQREPVKKRLADALDAVPADAEVCVIAHSMGSIIALDLIGTGTRRIDLLATIGSPLGIGVVQSQIGMDDAAKVELPNKIHRWVNFFDRLDIVAIDSDLEDDFPQITPVDVRIKNEFQGRNGRNHHKSYGYLRSEELGSVIEGFLAS